ncbi:MAG: hypothetical protein GXY91_02155 [Clostridia bacterium]|nr:hypothetical protein [Clostridia bacterium]
MYCENCHERPANVHFTKIVNGKKMEMHLCEYCAQKKQEQMSIPFMPDFSFSNLLTSMLQSDPFFSLQTVNRQDITCNKCQMTYSEFMETGRMGCDQCYSVFGNYLEHLLRRIHGNTQHLGKIPNRAGADIKLKKELTELKLELQKAVLNEEYEKAAQLRDKIKELEKGKGVQGGGLND